MAEKMKNLSLTISERIFAINIVNAFKGSLEILSYLITDMKSFSITDEEWVAADKKVVPFKDEDGTEKTNWTWNDEKGGLKEIEISKKTAEYLVEEINKKDKAGEFTVTDKAAITLKDKLT